MMNNTKKSDDFCADDTYGGLWDGTESTVEELEEYSRIIHLKVELVDSNEKVSKQDEIIGLLRKIDRKLDQIGDGLQPKQDVYNMSLEQVKDLIITEIETSSDTVYPGTIAVKYRIPYLDVEKAIKELREKRILQ